MDDQLERVQILEVVKKSGVNMETLKWKALDVLTAIFNCLAEQYEYFQTIGGKSGIFSLSSCASCFIYLFFSGRVVKLVTTNTAQNYISAKVGFGESVAAYMASLECFGIEVQVKILDIVTSTFSSLFFWVISLIFFLETAIAQHQMSELSISQAAGILSSSFPSFF